MPGHCSDSTTPAVRLDKGSDDGEPQARPSGFSVSRAVRAIETVEQSRLRIQVEVSLVVDNGKFYLALGERQFDLYRAAARSVAKSVVDEIVYNLTNSLGIAVYLCFLQAHRQF